MGPHCCKPKWIKASGAWQQQRQSHQCVLQEVSILCCTRFCIAAVATLITADSSRSLKSQKKRIPDLALILGQGRGNEGSFMAFGKLLLGNASAMKEPPTTDIHVTRSFEKHIWKACPSEKSWNHAWSEDPAWSWWTWRPRKLTRSISAPPSASIPIPS